MATRPARTRSEILSDINHARAKLAQLELELASLASPSPTSSRNFSTNSPRRPAICSLPLPNSWTPAELPIDVTRMPRLPLLPSRSVHQVYLHKSGAGNKPEEALLYESTSYRPLEFFGDAVVEYEVSRLLRKRLPLAGPGVLTHLRRRLVDNRTLSIIGWTSGLVSHIQFEKGSPFAGDDGVNCPQGIVAEVLEAYIGALAEDEGSREGLTQWFEEVFGPGSRVFLSLTEEGMKREAKMAEKIQRRTLSKQQNETVDPTSTSALAQIECNCADQPNSARLFTYDDEAQSGGAQKGGSHWHTVLMYEVRKLSCGRGWKRIDARQEAWATALASALKLSPSSQ
ncbi:hypothetical protein JCM5353_002437, partial [Sporobolomyces roseus]